MNTQNYIAKKIINEQELKEAHAAGANFYIKYPEGFAGVENVYLYDRTKAQAAGLALITWIERTGYRTSVWTLPDLENPTLFFCALMEYHTPEAGKTRPFVFETDWERKDLRYSGADTRIITLPHSGAVLITDCEDYEDSDNYTTQLYEPSIAEYIKVPSIGWHYTCLPRAEADTIVAAIYKASNEGKGC